MAENAEFTKLKDNLMNDVKTILNNFYEKILKQLEIYNQTPPAPPVQNQSQSQPPAIKTLPWLQHGVKGFLNKMWYGDHPDNPMWKNYKEHVGKRLSLDEYNYIKNNLESIINEGVGDFTSAANEMLHSLLNTITFHVNKAYEMGGGNPPVNNPQSQPATAAQPAADEPSKEPAEALPAATKGPIRQRKAKLTADKPAVATEAPKTGTFDDNGWGEIPPQKPEDEEPEADVQTLEPEDAKELAQANTPEEWTRNIGEWLKKIQSGDKKDARSARSAIKKTLANFGIEIKPKEKLVNLNHVDILVSIIAKLGEDSSSGIKPDDWKNPKIYKLFPVKIGDFTLKKAIKDYDAMRYEDEMERAKSSAPEGHASILSGNDDFDFNHTLEKYKKLLREHKKSDLDIIKSRKYSGKAKIAFFKECLN